MGQGFRATMHEVVQEGLSYLTFIVEKSLLEFSPKNLSKERMGKWWIHQPSRILLSCTTNTQFLWILRRMMRNWQICSVVNIKKLPAWDNIEGKPLLRLLVMFLRSESAPDIVQYKLFTNQFLFLMYLVVNQSHPTFAETGYTHNLVILTTCSKAELFLIKSRYLDF